MVKEPDTPLHRIRANMIERLRLYEDGTATTQSRDADGSIVDTTAEAIELLRVNIAELDRVIAGQPRR